MKLKTVTENILPSEYYFFLKVISKVKVISHHKVKNTFVALYLKPSVVDSGNLHQIFLKDNA